MCFFCTRVEGPFLYRFVHCFQTAQIIKNISFALEGLQFSHFHQSQILCHSGFYFGCLLTTFWHTFRAMGRHLVALGFQNAFQKALEKNTKNLVTSKGRVESTARPGSLEGYPVTPLKQCVSMASSKTPGRSETLSCLGGTVADVFSTHTISYHIGPHHFA